MITRGLTSILRSLSRSCKCLTAARKIKAKPKFTVPIPAPATGMFYEKPQRSVMIDKLLKDIRDLKHPAVFPFPDEPCDVCDTQVLRQTLDRYSDELLHALISHQMGEGRGNGTFLSAHDGKDEAYARTFFSILFSAELENMFEEVGRNRNFLYRHAASAIALYETLPYEDSKDYYRKAIALTGAVLEIMRATRDAGSSIMSNEVPLISYYSERLFYTARLTSDDLAEFICENTDQWKEIAEIAVQRRTADPSTIKGIREARIGSSTPSLNIGLL